MKQERKPASGWERSKKEIFGYWAPRAILIYLGLSLVGVNSPTNLLGTLGVLGALALERRSRDS